MRPKVTKFIWGDIVNISISRFNCSEVGLLNIIGLFEHETVIVEIGSVEKTPLFMAHHSIRRLPAFWEEITTDEVLYKRIMEKDERA